MDVPHPDFMQKQPKNEMLTATGFKTEKALMKMGKAVSVTVKGNQLDINPKFFNGSYITSSPERHILCSLDPVDITKTVLAAFGFSRIFPHNAS